MMSGSVCDYSDLPVLLVVVLVVYVRNDDDDDDEDDDEVKKSFPLKKLKAEGKDGE